MMKFATRLGSLAALSLIVSSPFGTNASAASSAPTALYGKSIMLSWGTNRVRKDLTTGETQSRAAIATLRVYVSSKGRIFSEKVGMRVGGRGRGYFGHRSRTSQEIAGEGDNMEVREWRTEGHSLVAYKTFKSGARRLVVDFDNDYKSCSLKVQFAREGGTHNIIQGHGRWEVLSIDVS